MWLWVIDLCGLATTSGKGFKPLDTIDAGEAMEANKEGILAKVLLFWAGHKVGYLDRLKKLIKYIGMSSSIFITIYIAEHTKYK